MEEIIEKLATILQEIESYHGVVHDASTYDHVKRLHQQARSHVVELRRRAHAERAEQLSALFKQWEEETSVEEQRETVQALIEAGILPASILATDEEQST